MALERAMQKKRDEESGGEPPSHPQQGSQYLGSFSAAEGGGPPPTESLHASMELSPPSHNPSLALVPQSAPQRSLAMNPPQSSHRQAYPSTSRGINPELAAYLTALSGPEDRTPLLYSGDIKSSLDQLRHDALSRYHALSHALGEREDRLTILLGSLGGRLGLPPAPPMPSLPSYSSAPLSLPPLSINHYQPSAPRPHASTAGSGGYGYGGSGGYGRSYSAWSGGMEPPGSASFFGEGLGGGGLRLSPFELDAGGPQPMFASTPISETRGVIPDSDLLSGLMVGRETTRMIYPQAGVDFDGKQARSTTAYQRIDSLRDLRYQKPSPLNYDDLFAQVTSASSDRDVTQFLPRSQLRSELDQTERYLRDYASRETRSRGAHSLPPQSNHGRREGGGDDRRASSPVMDQLQEEKPFTLPQI